MDLRKRGLDLRKSSWAPLGEPLGESWPLGGLLEVSSRTFGAIVEAIGAILGRSKTNYEIGFSHLGGQKAAEKDAKRVQHRVQEAGRAQNTKSSKTIVFQHNSMIFRSRGLFLEVKIYIKRCLIAV